MKSKNRTIALTLMIVFLMIFTACSSQNNDSSTEQPPTNKSNGQFSNEDAGNEGFDHVNISSEVVAGSKTLEEMGLTFTISDASPTGLTFHFTNTSDHEFIYSEDFWLYVDDNGSWESVTPIIENWTFTEPGYIVSPQSETEKTDVNWEWLFGELESGTYLFTKGILNFRGTGDFDDYNIGAKFEIQ